MLELGWNLIADQAVSTNVSFVDTAQDKLIEIKLIKLVAVADNFLLKKVLQMRELKWLGLKESVSMCLIIEVFLFKLFFVDSFLQTLAKL